MSRTPAEHPNQRPVTMCARLLAVVLELGDSPTTPRGTPYNRATKSLVFASELRVDAWDDMHA
jgi:hypothetical protein